MDKKETTYGRDSIEVEQKRVKTFLNNELKSFAEYVVTTRAMPNLMDGLRIGARKIVYAALTGDLKTQQKVKMLSLIGDVMKLHYNHGDASLMNTISQLASKHVFKYAPFDVVGQIGTLRIPKCDTAPRYLHIKKSQYLDFFKTDIELIERLSEDGDLIEPKNFYPIIPIVLLFRTNSPGFGFSFRCFSYNLNDIIDNCIKAITKGSCDADADDIPLTPEVEGIKQENLIFNQAKNCWYNVGEYELNFDTDTIMVTDLPYNVSFENYEDHLNLLIDKGYITQFNNLSLDRNIRYQIFFAKGRLKLMYSDKWKFFQTLKLFSKIIKDTLNCIDDGKILSFESPYELINYFVKKRLVIYSKRKTKTIQIIKEQIDDLSIKIRFINLVITNKLIISKRSVKDIIVDLDKFELPKEMLKLPISRLSQDEIDKSTKEINELTSRLHYIENTSIQEMYINDLIDFKRKYLNINKDYATK
jgi:DNA gyrase/topoisomerase IV subunit A